MALNRWTPLSDRIAGRAPSEVLHEGVPAHLEGPLRGWIYNTLRTEAFAQRVALNLQLIPARPSAAVPLKQPTRWWLARDVDANMLLDIVDCMLYLNVDAEMILAHYRGELNVLPDDSVAQLMPLLEEARSAFQVRVGDDEHHSGLERVVDATVTAAAEKAAQTADDVGRATAAQYLGSAWDKAYALHPDPGGAYADAVRAVEAAAIAFFLPKAGSPTLGTVLAHLREAGHNYELAISNKQAAPSGVEPLTGMIRLLWEGHRDRHSGGPTSAPITVEATQMAVHLAATLVQWLSSGAVVRKP